MFSEVYASRRPISNSGNRNSDEENYDFPDDGHQPSHLTPQPPMVPRQKKMSNEAAPANQPPPPPPAHKKSDARAPPSPLPHTQNNLISSSSDEFDDDEFDNYDDDYNDPEKLFATQPPISAVSAILNKRNVAGGSLRRGSNALQPLEYIPASEIQPALEMDDDDEDLYCDPEDAMATKPQTSFHGRTSDGEDIYTDGLYILLV